MQLSGIGVVILTSVSYVGLITVRGSPCESPHGASSVCDLSACDLSAGKDCSTLSNKVPHIASFAPASRAVTLALSPADRRAFEHLIGHALRETPAVLWATREFSKRMLRVLSAGAALNGTSSDAMMTAAFVTSHCGPWNTGYVGPSLPALRRTLASGNLREVWGLMYVLTKSHYFSHLMMSVLSPRAAVPPLTSAAELAAKYEMDAEAVAARYTLVRDTAHLNKSLGYAQGVPDFEFESFTSWVRFDFAARAHDGRLLWDAARLPKPTGCGTVELMSNDPSIEPPLSPDELAYQCAGQPPPCPLQWQPGALCYTLPNASWTLESGEVVPGVNERAALLGYRSAAAVSGTTANMLQLAELLGFGPHERVVRATPPTAACADAARRGGRVRVHVRVACDVCACVCVCVCVCTSPRLPPTHDYMCHTCVRAMAGVARDDGGVDARHRRPLPL